MFRGKVAVVTGASSGFGYEIAKALASKGAVVLAVARREERLRGLVDELGGEPHGWFVCDISDLDQIRSLGEHVRQRHGHIDLLVNNAGISSSGPLPSADPERMEQVIRTNLIGPMWTTNLLLDLLKAAEPTNRLPVVVNVASMAGRLASPGTSDYNASKFGLVGFTEAAFHDLAAEGVRMMMVNPGLADTEGFPMPQVKANPVTRPLVMEAPRVAKATLRGIRDGSFEVRVQWWLHLVYWLYLLAGPFRRVAARAIRGQIRGDF